MESHHKIYEKLDYFKTKKIPHIIFHGNSGTGKKTILKTSSKVFMTMIRKKYAKMYCM